ncbi:MAG: hypothetical protein GXP55_07715 [Deltaproteobacteria bacterium]|nr:hypothetical protein [Deltaproteobacteria bacterium]
MTWAEILNRKNHAIPTPDICSEAQQSLRDSGLDTIDGVVSLRLSARERVYCARFENIGYLLWWDPKHQVCPSHKKHT